MRKRAMIAMVRRGKMSRIPFGFGADLQAAGVYFVTFDFM